MKVYIVGEDAVTFSILKRVLRYCSNEIVILTELPARGGQIKSKIVEFNTLSASYPVILLTDLDAVMCAPELVRQIVPFPKNENFIFNVAIDEAEAWLMADIAGFATYFAIDANAMPISVMTKQGGRKQLPEMNFNYKSSMYLTHELIKKSKKTEFIQQFTPKQGAAKGPEYNSAIVPFIENKWSIDVARTNSDSLNRMILRINTLLTAYKQ